MLHASCVCHDSGRLPLVSQSHPVGRLSWGAGRERHMDEVDSRRFLSPVAFGAPTPMPPLAHDGRFALPVWQEYGHADFRWGHSCPFRPPVAGFQGRKSVQGRKKCVKAFVFRNKVLTLQPLCKVKEPYISIWHRHRLRPSVFNWPWMTPTSPVLTKTKSWAETWR